MLDHTSTAWLHRLLAWLELFEDGFSHRAQRGALRRYLEGLLSDSHRKSMEAMWARLSTPGSYQALQHFITHAPWAAERLWQRLRLVVPERTGVLILDGTSFPKQGTASVGVARQYCGALGKIASCQVAVTVALWTGVRAWILGARLYLPEAWLTPAQRTRAQIPATVRFQEKWRSYAMRRFTRRKQPLVQWARTTFDNLSRCMKGQQSDSKAGVRRALREALAAEQTVAAASSLKSALHRLRV